MSFTAADVIKRALRRSTLAPMGQDVPSKWLDEGLASFNELLALWRAQDVYIEPRVVDAADLNVPILLDDEYRVGLVFELAAHLCDTFNVPTPKKVSDYAGSLFAILYKHQNGEQRVKLDSRLTQNLLIHRL